MYAQAVRALRLRELQNMERMSAVHAGLGSIIPLQLLTMLTPLEMELRTCGLPYINLEFLKVIFPAMRDPYLTSYLFDMNRNGILLVWSWHFGLKHFLNYILKVLITSSRKS